MSLNAVERDPPAIQVDQLTHRYGSRLALEGVTLTVDRGEIFVFLGPNGGGKTTLFRVLSTLIPCQQGSVKVLGLDVRRETLEVRRRLGVVFQSPSLDKKLTVSENIYCHAALFGLYGAELRRRIDQLLEHLGLADRAGERAETLSGGLRRRCELAKSLIHAPPILLLDEPSTGLDPGARIDLWQYLYRLRDEMRVTIVLTTHLLEEADKASRIAILDRGKLVALDTPDALRATVGGDSVTIDTRDPDGLVAAITDRFQVAAKSLDGTVRLEQPDGKRWVVQLMEAFPDRIRAITLAKPTLEDVFIAKTGYRFGQVQELPHGR